VNSSSYLKDFERFIKELEARRRAERARKRRLEEPFRVGALYPKALRYCVRCALQGLGGFSRRYSHREIIHFLRVHGISEYPRGEGLCSIDSHFCQNQLRFKVDFNALPLSVDVLSVLNMFTKLDGCFTPSVLIMKPCAVREFSPAVRRQLAGLCPSVCGDALWAGEYLEVVRGYRQQ